VSQKVSGGGGGKEGTSEERAGEGNSSELHLLRRQKEGKVVDPKKNCSTRVRGLVHGTQNRSTDGEEEKKVRKAKGGEKEKGNTKLRDSGILRLSL